MISIYIAENKNETCCPVIITSSNIINKPFKTYKHARESLVNWRQTVQGTRAATWGISSRTISQHRFSGYERPVSLFFFTIYTVACRRGNINSASPVGRNHSIYGVTTRRRWTFRFEHGFGNSQARNGRVLLRRIFRSIWWHSKLTLLRSFVSIYHIGMAKKLQPLKVYLCDSWILVINLSRSFCRERFSVCVAYVHSLEVALHVVNFFVLFTVVLKGNIHAIKRDLLEANFLFINVYK